jgi:hypothetical protein
MERILSLDISSKTGWALLTSGPLNSFQLEEYGRMPRIKEDLNKAYPWSMMGWAQNCFNEIFKIVSKFEPDILVIEQTAGGSKASKSQKLLEWIHFLVAKLIIDNDLNSVYLQTGEWRSATGAQMTKEEKARNKYVKEYIKEWKKTHPQEFIISKDGKRKKKPVAVYDQAGTKIGKVGKKNVSIRRATELFGPALKKPLLRKDEDMAEAILIAYAYHVRKNNAVQNV